MITNPVVFVLGAGASCHLGYPTGRRMLEIIIQNLTVQNGIPPTRQQLLDLSYSDENIDQFAEALLYSGQDSVDAFLEHRSEFMEIGKFMIAQALIPHENLSTLFTAENNWYHYLFRHLNAPLDDFAENAISFITFNYDRSIEQFLFTALLNKYGAPAAEVSEVLRGVRIVHVHGQLGYLPWQDANGRPYENIFDTNETRARAEKIKIIYEAIDADEDFVAAQAILKDAARVHFLGFGYHETNMRRLGFPWPGKKAVRGSCFQLTRHEMEQIMEKYGNLRLGDEGWNCYQYLRNFVNFV